MNEKERQLLIDSGDMIEIETKLTNDGGVKIMRTYGPDEIVIVPGWKINRLNSEVSALRCQHEIATVMIDAMFDAIKELQLPPFKVFYEWDGAKFCIYADDGGSWQVKQVNYDDEQESKRST